MNKFSVYIPVNGKRDALIAYFNKDAAHRGYDISEYISVAGVPADPAEQIETELLAENHADTILEKEIGTGVELSSILNVVGEFEITDDDGVVLGFEFEIYTGVVGPVPWAYDEI